MKANKRKGWPLWVYLAFLSIVFSLLLIIWFVRTLDGDLKNRLAVTTSATHAKVAATDPQYSLKQQPLQQSERIVAVETEERMTSKPKHQISEIPHSPPRVKKRKETKRIINAEERMRKRICFNQCYRNRR